jgi:hypothetical protein
MAVVDCAPAGTAGALAWVAAPLVSRRSVASRLAQAALWVAPKNNLFFRDLNF